MTIRNILRERGRQMSRTLEMGRRFLELREAMSAKEAAKTVNEEFGSDYQQRTISGYASRYRESLERSEQDEHSPGSERAEPSEPSPHTLTEERVREICGEVFEEMITNMQNVPTISREDLPPEPETIRGGEPGRRENRRYRKTTITVDEGLWQAFEAERKRQGVSVSRMADICFWRALGKPRMSFEE